MDFACLQFPAYEKPQYRQNFRNVAIVIRCMVIRVHFLLELFIMRLFFYAILFRVRFGDFKIQKKCVFEMVS